MILGAVSCCYLALCAVNVMAALVLVAACCVIYSFLQNRELPFGTFILILPFGSSPLLSLPFGMSTLRILFILSVITIAFFFLYRMPQRTSTAFTIFLILLAILFTVAWIRSAEYALATLTSGYVGRMSVFRYLADYVSWSCLALVPMVGIAYFYRGEKDFERILKTISVSLVFLVGFLFFVFLFRVGNKGDFEYIRSVLGAYVGLHCNDIVNFFLLSFPVILAWAFHKKSRFSILALLAILAGTLLCFSRTAYFVVAFAFFLYLLLSGRSKWIPFVVLAAALLVNFLLPEMVLDRASTGLVSGNYDELSAGRIGYIWAPLVEELKSDPGLLVFGSGRYGILNTDAWREARISLVTHAHNMYLDGILDTGLIGLAVFLSFFAFLLLHFGKYARKCRKVSPFYSSLLTGCIVSIVSYLISGLSGRTFFPTLSNAFLWIVIGLGAAVCGSLKTSQEMNKRILPE